MNNAREQLRALIKAKAYSDKGLYKEKKRIMGPLLANNPKDFIVDAPGHMTGITHLATKFKMHVPRDIIPTTMMLKGAMTLDEFKRHQLNFW